MAERPKKILIIKPSAMGDIVLALPVLSALHKSFPQARISWLVRTEFAPLLEGHPYLSEVILFDRKFLGKAWKNPKAFGSLVSLIARLRKAEFDLVLDLQGLFRTAFLGWASGCKKRFGPDFKREFSHFFYSESIKPPGSIHLVDCLLNIAKAAGASADSAEFVFPTNTKADDALRRLLAESSAQEGEYAVLVPGAADRDKRWPVERFAAMADRISEKSGLSIIAVGTTGEKDLIRQIREKAHVQVKDLAGRTDISVLISLLRRARLVISNDTGPGHIAVGLGVPLVMIFGRTNPSRVAPYGRPECIAAIEPYGRSASIDSFEEKYDIRHVTVDQVFEKACRQLR